MQKSPTKKSKGDIVYGIVKAGVGAIPNIGGPAQVLFENLLTSPFDRRKQEWLDSLVKVITEIEEKIDAMTLEKLSKNPAFISLVQHASQISLRTHQEEKLSALRNAVYNAALPNTIDENIQMVFLRFIDQFTPLHLRMLVLLDDAQDWMRKNNIKNPEWVMGGIGSVIELCLREVRADRELYSQIFRELQSNGLLIQGNILNTTMTGSSILRSHTTEFGKKFLRFISKV